MGRWQEFFRECVNDLLDASDPLDPTVLNASLCLRLLGQQMDEAEDDGCEAYK
jgi:hypothetical protein